MLVSFREFLAIAVFMCMLVLQGCVGVQPYQTTASPAETDNGHRHQPVPDKQAVQCEAGDDCLLFAEYDGFGRMFNRSQLSQIAKTAGVVASGKGTVVVFVHGWHHNAMSDDENLASFRQLLKSARKLQGDKPAILGIYVGWPGESVSVEPFSTLTFWERKNTAHSVGGGELFELFERLSQIRLQNPDSKLVIIGHSFGGAVSYTALANRITEQILRDPQPDVQGDAPRSPWDLLVLVNPAFEAMRVRSQMAAARSRNYRRTQIPHVVFITTEADDATRTAFPAGRFISTFFDRYADDDGQGKALNNTAIGHYIPYVTHQLALFKPSGCAVESKAEKADLIGPKMIGALASGQAPNACYEKLPGLLNAKPVELLRCDHEGMCSEVAGKSHFLAKGDALQGYVPLNMPVMNIRATGDVMHAHNDIWNDTMQSFLTQLIVQMVKAPGVVPSSKLPEIK